MRGRRTDRLSCTQPRHTDLRGEAKAHEFCPHGRNRGDAQPIVLPHEFCWEIKRILTAQQPSYGQKAPRQHKESWPDLRDAQE